MDCFKALTYKLISHFLQREKKLLGYNKNFVLVRLLGLISSAPIGQLVHRVIISVLK